MMTAHRDLPFPLVIICLVFIRGCTPLPTTSEVTGTNPLKASAFAQNPRNLPPASDYEDYTDPPVVPETTSSKILTGQRCHYDPCLEGQTPCAKLQASTGCSCPGFTLSNEIPNAPEVKTVSWNGSEVVVHWCAPYSVVLSYKVTVAGQKMEWEFSKDKRRGAVGNIDHIAEVCVFAVNAAGSEKHCMMYHPRDHNLPLKAGLIGGALGFLLLLLLAVLLWRHKKQRKQKASMPMHYIAETQ